MMALINKISLGIIFIISGTVSNFFGLWPHFSTIAYDNTLGKAVSHASGPTVVDAVNFIPPIYYYLVILGSIPLVLGSFLVVSAVRGRRLKSVNLDL